MKKLLGIRNQTLSNSFEKAIFQMPCDKEDKYWLVVTSIDDALETGIWNVLVRQLRVTSRNKDFSVFYHTMKGDL